MFYRQLTLYFSQCVCLSICFNLKYSIENTVSFNWDISVTNTAYKRLLLLLLICYFWRLAISLIWSLADCPYLGLNSPSYLLVDRWLVDMLVRFWLLVGLSLWYSPFLVVSSSFHALVWLTLFGMLVKLMSP